MSQCPFLWDLWLDFAGHRVPSWEPAIHASYEELQRTEWSPEFESLMRRRLIFGAYRYGRLGDPKRPRWKWAQYAQTKIHAYEETGNLEFLVDAANLVMVEFVDGRHPLRHWYAVDHIHHAAEEDK